jgi:hypothetical protein
VHIIPGGGGRVDRSGETIDHVGFRLSGNDRYRDKLTALGIRYSLMDLTELDERRIFIRTPTGVLLELVFRSKFGVKSPNSAWRADCRKAHSRPVAPHRKPNIGDI